MIGKLLQQVAGSQIGQSVGRMASKPLVQKLGSGAAKVGGGAFNYGKEMVGAVVNPASIGMTAVGMAPMVVMQMQAGQQQQAMDAAMQMPDPMASGMGGGMGQSPDAMAQMQLQQQTAAMPEAPPPGYASGVPMQTRQSGGDMNAVQDMAVAATNPANAGLPQVDPETISRERQRLQRQVELNTFYDHALNQLRNKQRAEER